MTTSFSIADFGIFYDQIANVGATPATATVRNWGFDTLVGANRRAYNDLASDTAWSPEQLQELRSGSGREVLAYVNVAKADRRLDTYADGEHSFRLFW